MNLTEVWAQVEWYLQNGISIIPARDRDITIKNKTYLAKTPCGEWEDYKYNLITKDELWKRMEQYDTSAIAIICGKVSGNLEVIDIDVKYKPGIEVLILKDIKELLPHIFSKLRIHKSPSSGFHFFYKILGTPPKGNTKISGRLPTPEELKENPKAKPKYFVETRGEGGYVLAPPSLGYITMHDVEIPTITPEERESIINICKNYNEIIKEPAIYKPRTNFEKDYYDENPFLHYSRVADPKELLNELGWKFYQERGKYIWFTRPGKDTGVSGSFNLETRIFWSWSPNWDGEEEKGYFLSSLLIDFKFDKDAKKAYRWLINNGYGKVKYKYEQETIKEKAYSGGEIPPNFSQEAKESFEQYKQYAESLHPYGMFWNVSEQGDIEISREKLYEISAKLGFRNYDEAVMQIIGNFIYKKTKREYYDTIKAYIKIDDLELKENVLNAYEKFLQANGEFTMERLLILRDDEILIDQKNVCYKFYEDCWFVIDNTSIIKMPYNELKKLVFSDKICNRRYISGDRGRYIEFLEFAVELKKNYEYVQRITGYLSHEYKDSTTPYIIVLTEKCADPKEGGGSGKNLYCELLSYTTTFTNKPASQSGLNEKFFQSWSGEKIFAISDLPKDFRFEFFKELVSGSGVVKKLFQNEKTMPVHKLPKIICQTQYSFEINDGGLRRRIIPMEFTDHFTRMQGVDTFFGIMFPDEWNDSDWGGYNDFIHKSIRTWLKGGNKLFPNPLSEGGWSKQFKLAYNDTIVNLIDYYWDTWLGMRFVTNEQFKQHLDNYYEQNSIATNYRPSIPKINRAIEEYARRNNVLFEKEKTWTDEAKRGFRGKAFTRFDDDIPF